jgi:8-oxo-dGTP diphosphatase
MDEPATKLPMPKVIGTKKNISYIERQAVRLVISNSKNQIIIHARKENYYKLPGGGIEAGEDGRVAGEREAMEETGCKVEIDGDCIATTKEWRNDLHRISYCYRARTIEDIGAPELTEEEVADGLRHEWVEVEEAMEKMKGCEPTSVLGEFIRERDYYFVEVYA